MVSLHICAPRYCICGDGTMVCGLEYKILFGPWSAEDLVFIVLFYVNGPAPANPRKLLGAESMQGCCGNTKSESREVQDAAFHSAIHVLPLFHSLSFLGSLQSPSCCNAFENGAWGHPKCQTPFSRSRWDPRTLRQQPELQPHSPAGRLASSNITTQFQVSVDAGVWAGVCNSLTLCLGWMAKICNNFFLSTERQAQRN